MQFLTLRAACAPALLKHFRTAILFALTLCTAIAILVTGPGGRLLTPVKAATLTVCPNGCSSSTINGAIALANPGDTIQVAAGTYNEFVEVNKNNLTLLGANSSNNPCNAARGPESIVGLPNAAFHITANNVVVQGFLVQGVSSGLGAGILTEPVTGTRIRNNIIQNNVLGIWLSGNLIEVSGNAIRNNNSNPNNPLAFSGFGIYSDYGLMNTTIAGNCFTGHTRAALLLIGAPEIPQPVSGVTVSANTATNDAAFSFIGGTNWVIQRNLSNGSRNDAIRFRGGVNGATVINNQLTNGAAGGISVRNEFGGPNANIQINCNRLVGFDKTAAIIIDADGNTGTLNAIATAAIIVDAGGHMGILNAEGNFFGCNAGPNNAGCGTVSASDNNLDFTPWQVLTLTAASGPVFSGQTSALTVGFGSSGPGGIVSCGFQGIPVTFTSTCGTVNPAGSVFDSGIARTTLVANAPGVCTSSATVDNQTVTVNQTVLPLPTLDIADPSGCIGSGTVLPVSLRITNPGATSLTMEAQIIPSPGLIPPGLTPLPNTCTANVPGTCQVLNNSTVSFNGTLPAGQTAVITYQAQVVDYPPNTPLCLNAFIRLNQSSNVTATDCATINCPPAGPGALFPASAEVSGQKTGSVLVYNLFSSSGSAPNTQNTRISMTNTHATQPVAVHLFFVDSSSCSVADAFVCLSQNQTASFLAADFDPGTTGYVVAIASDPITGCPINFNYLIGDEFIKLASGHAANLAAESIAAIAGGLPACNDNSVTAQLNFNGVSYNRLPRVLADSNLPSRADGNDTLLIINRIGGNLATGAATIGTLFGILYDDAEAGFSFSLAGGCQLRGSFGATGFPRTVPPVNTIIPAGRTGWLKLYHQTEDIALLGAAINFNANAGTQSGAFNQGHNLHKLTLSASATLTIPVFPPRC